MSIERLQDIIRNAPMNDYNIRAFFEECINTFIDQSNELADLQQELAKKEDAIDIGDIIKEARLRNG